MGSLAELRRAWAEQRHRAGVHLLPHSFQSRLVVLGSNVYGAFVRRSYRGSGAGCAIADRCTGWAVIIALEQRSDVALCSLTFRIASLNAHRRRMRVTGSQRQNRPGMRPKPPACATPLPERLRKLSAPHSRTAWKPTASAQPQPPSHGLLPRSCPRLGLDPVCARPVCFSGRRPRRRCLHALRLRCGSGGGAPRDHPALPLDAHPPRARHAVGPRRPVRGPPPRCHHLAPGGGRDRQPPLSGLAPS